MRKQAERLKAIAQGNVPGYCLKTFGLKKIQPNFVKVA